MVDVQQLRATQAASDQEKVDGTVTGPTLGASTVAVENETDMVLWGRISSGTVTVVKVDGVTIGGLTTGDWIRLRPGSTFAITYSVAPTLQWFEE